MSAPVEPLFLSRFHRVWAQARRVQLAQAACWIALTALAGFVALAAIDYWLEMPRLARMVAVVLIVVASTAVGSLLSARSLRRWRRNTTAAAIERFFPQLGQRIRTTVQY